MLLVLSVLVTLWHKVQLAGGALEAAEEEAAQEAAADL